MLINKARVRKHALEVAATGRLLANGTPRFKRVSNDFYAQVDTCVRDCIERTIRSLPSAGQTI